MRGCAAPLRVGFCIPGVPPTRRFAATALGRGKGRLGAERPAPCLRGLPLRGRVPAAMRVSRPDRAASASLTRRVGDPAARRDRGFAPTQPTRGGPRAAPPSGLRFVPRGAPTLRGPWAVRGVAGCRPPPLCGFTPPCQAAFEPRLGPGQEFASVTRQSARPPSPSHSNMELHISSRAKRSVTQRPRMLLS